MIGKTGTRSLLLRTTKIRIASELPAVLCSCVRYLASLRAKPPTNNSAVFVRLSEDLEEKGKTKSSLPFLSSPS
jgi:hypothetical protein